MCSHLDQSRPWQTHGCRKYNWGLGQLNWLCWSLWHLIKCARPRVRLMNVRPQRTLESLLITWTKVWKKLWVIIITGAKMWILCETTCHHVSYWVHMGQGGSWIAWERISSLQCKWLKADVICPLSQKSEHPQKSVLFALSADASTLTLMYHSLS